MNDHPLHLAPDDLLIKMLAGEASDAEKQQAMDWIQASEENKEYFESLRKTWSSIGEVSSEELGEIDKAWTKFEGRTAKKIRPLWPQLIRIAAVLLVGIAFATALYWWGSTEPNTLLKEIVNSNSFPTKHLLDDGSAIYLKPQAQVSVPEVFGENERRLSLQGEAFFEVSEDSTRPFSVQTAQTEIRVLGTSFLVKADPDEVATEVLVSSGKVSFSPKEGTSTPLSLTKGQGATYSHQFKTLIPIENLNENLSAWATRKFKFSKTPLGEVAISLSQAFQVDISFTNEALKSCEYGGTFEGQNLEEIFQIIENTYPINIKREGEQYIISGSACE